MAPGSASKNAKSYGPYPDSTKSPAALAAQNLARAAAGKQPIPPISNAHTTAQLVPTQLPGSRATPASDTNDSPEPPYVGMPQPDDVTQPYKDGRIRNPVPSKLKGMTSNASGRFGVMHMDIKGKDLATDRDAAAKRTSENTAMAAKMAFQNGYQPHRKSNWMRIPEETPDPAVPFTGTTPYNHALYGLKQPTPNPPKERPEPFSRPLDPKETKEEQARLLTLLRTLQPVAVVDQLCKALAYFGGVPEAPPPQDGKFPESAEANGSGSVFVGWVAEIFPDIDAQGRPKTRPFRAPEPSPAQVVEKRGRGRPKGSKASKFRSDKGVKKGPKKNLAAEDSEADGADNDDSWVDIDDTMMGNDQDVVITGEQVRQTPDHQAAGEVEITASAKKRGRPKGSKNKAKDGAAAPETADVTSNPQPISALFSIGKKGGRPKGSKNRPKETPASSSSAPAVADQAAPQPPVMTAQSAAVPETQQQGDTEFALAALKAFNESHPADPANQASSFQPVNANAPSASQATGKKAGTAKGGEKAQTAKKRKRNTKSNEAAQNPAATGTVAVTTGTAASAPVQPSVNGVQGTPTVETTAPAPPAPKRQRKSAKAKAAANTTTHNTPVVDLPAAGGPSQVSQTHVPPAPVMQPADTQAYTSPTIEELEAQLEQNEEQTLRSPEVTTMKATSRQAQPSQPPPPQPQILQPQPQATQPPKAVHTGQQMSEQQQRQAVLARQRQQYHQQQQQQTQQAVARTASPSVNHISTASPHLSVQPASPNVNPAHSVSPSLHQQRTSNSQTPTSVTSQVQNQQGQQARGSQSYYAPQAPSSQSQYSQQQPQQYSSTQSKQHFPVQQPQPQQGYPSPQPSQQQQSYTAPQQPPQYPQTKSQSYSSQQPQQPYAPQQQQYSSQQRIAQQQYNTSSAGSTSQTMATQSQSPQYGTSTPSGYNSGDGTFRANSSAGLNFGTSSYASNHTTNAPRTNNIYPTSTANSYGSPNQQQQLSSYATSRRPLPTSTSHQPPVQNVQQGLPQNIGGFSDFGNLGFDISSLDTTNPAAGHGSLGLNAAPYNIGGAGGGNVSRPAAGTGNFTSLSSFDSTLRNDGNSYYGLPHRR
ncbi:hypothetical protein VMCG_01489 [Cytospora schulzeri]|uniref:Uncharacterized protein n=1 Tax=Cytospora schulzeri TaxID=448051 RepID=A0A423X5Y4_9PEZI|nr:hypothetical protein VMCG_01489 [Valsa malicola]